MPAPDAPTVRYFRAMTGAWSGVYRFEITDPAAVASPLDRLRMTLMARLGPCRMDTTVAWMSDDTVRHTTRVTCRGMPGLYSVEVFSLSEDGRTLTVRMAQRLAPDLWRLRTFPEGSGVVEDPEIGAAYALPWIGGVVDQRARIVDDGVLLTQTTPWFRAEARLRRR